ncbi:MAG: amino acid permease [Chlamydiales bacterium]|nr:amino acid permease [Chlamydiales bacterium]
MGIWDRKSVELLRESDQAGVHQLKRTLGAGDLVLLGIGAIIGAGLFSITGIAAADNAGPAIIISFLIAALGCSFAALCYSEMAAMIPVSGSAYTYAYATLGELLAWIIGWDLILEYAVGAATVSISWSAYATSLMHDLNIHLPMQWLASPWQPVHLNDGTMAFGHANLPAVFIVVVLSLVLIWGIKQSAFINAIIVVLKVSVVIIFIAIGVQYINPANYHPFIPENQGNFGRFGWSGVMRAAGIIFFAYIGFDAISTAAQETKDPQKNVPRGILGSLAICTVLYVAFAAVLVGLVNYKRLGVAAPIALAIDQTPYVWLNIAVKIAILAGFTSVILVMMLGQSRIFFSMAKDGLLPPLFAELHPRFDTPWRANIVLMLLVSLFGAFAPIHLVGEMTSIGTLLAFTIVCASVLILRYQHPEIPRDFRTPWVPVIPLLGILLCVSMMISLGWENWARLLGWLLIGLVVYWIYGSRHSNLKR